MKTRKLYQCEKCGAEYELKERAERCENLHLTHEYAEEECEPEARLPYRVKLGFSNDEVGIYELVRFRRVKSDV